MGLEGGVWTLRLQFWPHVLNLGRIGQKWAEIGRIWQNWAELGRIGQNWAEFGRIWQNLDFEAAGGGTEKKEKEKEEKISHMCESIGHRPLRGRCPKRMNK